MRRALATAAILLLSCVLPASALAGGDDAGNERIVLLGPVVVDRGEATDDVIVGQGDVNVRGTVKGDLVVGDGDATIRGTVTGDVVTFTGQAILGRRARIGGDVLYGDKRPKVAPGADVGGEVKKLHPGNLGIGVEVGTGIAVGVWLAVTISALVLGLLLVALAPKALAAAVRAATKSTLGSILWGLLLFFAIPILGVLLCITVLGIPLGVGLLLALAPLYALAYVTSAFVIGKLILKKGGLIVPFVVGLVILRVLALIPIAGGIIWFLATVLGLGALFVALRSAR